MSGTMYNTYDAAKFHVITRQWFGLTTKMGGECSAAIAPLTGSASTATLVTRWYPRGPIKVLKIGYLNVATASAAANATGATSRALIPFEFYKSSAALVARTTLLGSLVARIALVALTYTPLWNVASKTDLASQEVEAGRFITIFAATPTDAAGDQAAGVGTCMVSGSFAFYIDWVPKYDPSNEKWNT